MTTSTQSFTVYCVEEREGKKDFWTRIGKAWPHKTKSGFNINLSALPINGRIVVMDDAETEQKTEEAS